MTCPGSSVDDETGLKVEEVHPPLEGFQPAQAWGGGRGKTCPSLGMSEPQTPMAFSPKLWLFFARHSSPIGRDGGNVLRTLLGEEPVVLGVFVEALAQELPAAVQARHDRSQRAAHGLGDFLVRPILEISHDHGLAEIDG